MLINLVIECLLYIYTSMKITRTKQVEMMVVNMESLKQEVEYLKIKIFSAEQIEKFLKKSNILKCFKIFK